MINIKSSLDFVSNIPTPYNLDLFTSLSKYYELHVYFYDKTEESRYWNLNLDSKLYSTKVFDKNVLTTFFLKIHSKLYFSLDCLFWASRTKSSIVILSGIYFSLNTIFSLIILKIRGKKIYWYGEKVNNDVNWFFLLFKKVVFFPIFLCANGILAIGYIAKDSYVNLGFKKSIFITPYAINNGKFRNQNETICFNKNSNKFTIISSGNLIPRKGFDILLKAINLLDVEIQDNILVVILGEGPDKEKLLSLKGSNYDLFFPGFIPPEDLFSFYRKADLFVLCSRYDGWGVVVNEALASSLPIIVSSSVGASEYVEINGGFIFDNDVFALRDYIKLFFFNKDLRFYMGNYNFNKSNMVDSDSIAKYIFNSI